MQISSTNYNVLGKIGPHYERPDFRPPEQNTTDGAGVGTGLDRTRDRQTISSQAPKSIVKKTTAEPTPKLNLTSAQELTLNTKELLAQTSAQISLTNVHNTLQTSLMKPVYV